MFINTLGYTNDKFITYALQSKIAESTRGKHDHFYHSVTESDDLYMQDHIETFEPGIAHYRRAHAPHCLYVDPSLTIIDMYEDYKKETVKDGRKTLSMSSYQRKLKKLNISFAKLGHKQCQPCLKFEEHRCVWYEMENSCECCNKKETSDCECCKKLKSQFMNNPFKKEKSKKKNQTCTEECACCKVHSLLIEERHKLKDTCEECIEHKEHLERTRLARKDYNKDKKLSEEKKPDQLYLSLDLQKVRMLPEIPGVKSAVFTQRIAAYNESFSPIGENCGESVGVIWHQGVAGRNDEDIVSAWKKYVRKHVHKHVKYMTVWMDNCGPQNKNWTIFPALVGIVNSEKKQRRIWFK